MLLAGTTPHEALGVIGLALMTMTRVFVLIGLASLIWVPVGVWVGMRPRAARIVQPVAQFLAAFPANLLFPVAVYGIVTWNLNADVWLSPLMILGTQWCILFNVIAGASAYSRVIDWKRFRAIADAVGAKLMVDMAHYAGLVAAGVYPSPVGIATVDSGSRNACSMRWVWNVSCTVKALAANASSKSAPRVYALVDSTFESVPHTDSGAVSARAARASVFGGWTS